MSRLRSTDSRETVARVTWTTRRPPTYRAVSIPGGGARAWHRARRGRIDNAGAPGQGDAAYADLSGSVPTDGRSA